MENVLGENPEGFAEAPGGVRARFVGDSEADDSEIPLVVWRRLQRRGANGLLRAKIAGDHSRRTRAECLVRGGDDLREMHASFETAARDACGQQFRLVEKIGSGVADLRLSLNGTLLPPEIRQPVPALLNRLVRITEAVLERHVAGELCAVRVTRYVRLRGELRTHVVVLPRRIAADHRDGSIRRDRPIFAQRGRGGWWRLRRQ